MGLKIQSYIIVERDQFEAKTGSVRPGLGDELSVETIDRFNQKLRRSGLSISDSQLAIPSVESPSLVAPLPRYQLPFKASVIEPGDTLSRLAKKLCGEKAQSTCSYQTLYRDNPHIEQRNLKKHQGQIIYAPQRLASRQRKPVSYEETRSLLGNLDQKSPKRDKFNTKESFQLPKPSVVSPLASGRTKKVIPYQDVENLLAKLDQKLPQTQNKPDINPSERLSPLFDEESVAQSLEFLESLKDVSEDQLDQVVKRFTNKLGGFLSLEKTKPHDDFDQLPVLPSNANLATMDEGTYRVDPNDEATLKALGFDHIKIPGYLFPLLVIDIKDRYQYGKSLTEGFTRGIKVNIQIPAIQLVRFSMEFSLTEKGLRRVLPTTYEFVAGGGPANWGYSFNTRSPRGSRLERPHSRNTLFDGGVKQYTRNGRQYVRFKLAPTPYFPLQKSIGLYDVPLEVFEKALSHSQNGNIQGFYKTITNTNNWADLEIIDLIENGDLRDTVRRGNIAGTLGLKTIFYQVLVAFSFTAAITIADDLAHDKQWNQFIQKNRIGLEAILPQAAYYTAVQARTMQTNLRVASQSGRELRLGHAFWARNFLGFGQLFASFGVFVGVGEIMDAFEDYRKKEGQDSFFGNGVFRFFSQMGLTSAVVHAGRAPTHSLLRLTSYLGSRAGEQLWHSLNFALRGGGGGQFGGAVTRAAGRAMQPVYRVLVSDTLASFVGGAGENAAKLRAAATRSAARASAIGAIVVWVGYDLYDKYERAFQRLKREEDLNQFIRDEIHRISGEKIAVDLTGQDNSREHTQFKEDWNYEKNDPKGFAKVLSILASSPAELNPENPGQAYGLSNEEIRPYQALKGWEILQTAGIAKIKAANAYDFNRPEAIIAAIRRAIIEAKTYSKGITLRIDTLRNSEQITSTGASQDYRVEFVAKNGQVILPENPTPLITIAYDDSDAKDSLIDFGFGAQDQGRHHPSETIERRGRHTINPSINLDKMEQAEAHHVAMRVERGIPLNTHAIRENFFVETGALNDFPLLNLATYKHIASPELLKLLQALYRSGYIPQKVLKAQVYGRFLTQILERGDHHELIEFMTTGLNRLREDDLAEITIASIQNFQAKELGGKRDKLDTETWQKIFEKDHNKRLIARHEKTLKELASQGDYKTYVLYLKTENLFDSKNPKHLSALQLAFENKETDFQPRENITLAFQLLEEENLAYRALSRILSSLDFDQARNTLSDIIDQFGSSPRATDFREEIENKEDEVYLALINYGFPLQDKKEILFYAACFKASLYLTASGKLGQSVSRNELDDSNFLALRPWIIEALDTKNKELVSDPDILASLSIIDPHHSTRTKAYAAWVKILSEDYAKLYPGRSLVADAGLDTSYNFLLDCGAIEHMEALSKKGRQSPQNRWMLTASYQFIEKTGIQEALENTSQKERLTQIVLDYPAIPQDKNHEEHIVRMAQYWTEVYPYLYELLKKYRRQLSPDEFSQLEKLHASLQSHRHYVKGKVWAHQNNPAVMSKTISGTRYRTASGRWVTMDFQTYARILEDNRFIDKTYRLLTAFIEDKKREEKQKLEVQIFASSQSLKAMQASTN